MEAISAKERQELARQIDVNEQYLYQCLRGLRDMDPLKAAEAEVATNGRLRRQMLNREWARIWPELKAA